MKGEMPTSPRMWRGCIFLVISILASLVYSRDAIISTFSDKGNSSMNHFVVNKNTGKIYVGAVNRLYQLSADLNLENVVETGPRKSSPKCPPQKYSCGEGQMTDIFNKVLVINYEAEELISCSTLFHGMCKKRSLSNINITVDGGAGDPVVANSPNATTYAFIAPGPSLDGGLQPNVLYVGATRTNIGLSLYRDLVPAFCSRNLKDFDIAYKSQVEHSSKKEIETQHRETFKVNYMYGFSSENFSYMLTLQKASTQVDTYASKIFRVCQNDKNFYSYAELFFQCKLGNVDYNLVQAAYLAKAGNSLAQNIGIPTTEDVLYAVFAKGNPGTADPTDSSALCIYPLRNIRKIFTKNIKECFRGVGNIGPEHLTKSTLCQKTRLQIDDNYCGSLDINTPIAGSMPVDSEPTLVLKSTTVSAVAVSITYDYTVAFIGTTDGRIIKVSIESRTQASHYETITVVPHQRIFPDLYFDLEKEHLYVMTPHKLSKVQVQDCSRYTTCEKCISVKDPYCGWCTLENK